MLFVFYSTSTSILYQPLTILFLPFSFTSIILISTVSFLYLHWACHSMWIQHRSKCDSFNFAGRTTDHSFVFRFAMSKVHVWLLCFADLWGTEDHLESSSIVLFPVCFCCVNLYAMLHWNLLSILKSHMIFKYAYFWTQLSDLTSVVLAFK